MTTTTFSAGTVVASAWLNDANTATYKDHNNAKLAAYGAVGDGVTDDTAALTAWLAAGGGFLPPGTYKVSTPLPMSTANSVIIGMGKGCSIVTAHASNDVVVITASGTIVSGVSITSSVTRSAGWYITIGGGLSDVTVRNNYLTNYKNGIACGGAVSATVTIANNNLTTTVSGGIGIQYSTSANWVDCILHNTLISGPVGNLAKGLYITNIGDLTVTRLQVIQAGEGISVTPGNGQIVQYLNVSDSLIDTCASYGINIAPTGTGKVGYSGTLKFNNVWSATNVYGCILSPTNVGNIYRAEFNGCDFVNNTAHGLYIGGSSVTDTSVNGGSYSGNTTTGIYIVGGSDGVTINGARIGSANGLAGNATGINLAVGASADIVIEGNDVSGNTVANITDAATGAAGMVIANNTGFGYGSATYDPGSLADAAGVTTTVTVTGARLGDMAMASFSLDLQGITLTAWVSSANTVSVRFQNESGGVLDLASGALRASIVRRT